MSSYQDVRIIGVSYAQAKMLRFAFALSRRRALGISCQKFAHG